MRRNQEDLGIELLPYHAKMHSDDRTANLAAFRAHSNNEVLVSTDLASRGLDIPDVSTVVQMQFATNVVAHLHRVGRCGRLTSKGRKGGRAVVYYGDEEIDLVKAIRKAEESEGEVDGELMGKDDDGEEEDQLRNKTGGGGGTVEKAFSRKRGFRKKFKKAARPNRERED